MTGQDIGLVVDPDAARSAHSRDENAWWLYATEVLDHERLPYRSVEVGALASLLGDLGVVVLSQPLDRGEELEAWVRAGGALLAIGDPGGLADLCGVTVIGGGEGHVGLRQHAVWTRRPDLPLHAMDGVRLAIGDDAEPLADWDDGSAAITVRRVGRGFVLCCGVDLWQTIVRIQQGEPVAADGVPAADGTAPIDDGLLKCEDGLVLDFERDRALPPGEPAPPDPFDHAYPAAIAVPMFHRPQADLWRSAFLQALLSLTEKAGIPLPWLHYWPAGVSAIGHLSHDSDLNKDDDGRAALDTFAEAGVNVTWCQVFPGGYDEGIYRDITAAGHEHALHYNAMEDADIARWGWAQMRAQYAWAQAVTGSERIVSNKNHYTRWEGWTEFYRWCERVGIEIDESRGPSKQGTVGFPFGTAHVSFPIDEAASGNRFLDVLNLPLHTQDLAWAGHESIRDVILDGAESVQGVAHFLFHGPHLRARPGARKACLALVTEARRRGMPWWTAGEINRWERLRRLVSVAVRPASDGWIVETTASAAVPSAGVLLSLPGLAGEPVLRTGEGAVGRVERHGRSLIELSVDIPVGTARWVLQEPPA